MLHAGSEIFHDAKVGGGLCRRHDDVTYGKKFVNGPHSSMFYTCNAYQPV